MFLSLSLNWEDFWPCSLLSKFPLSNPLDARKVGDQILFLIGVSSFLQFCPNLRLLYQNSPCTISFLIQVPSMTNDRKENLRAYFETSIEFWLHSSVFPLTLHTMSRKINMKMSLPLKCSGSHSPLSMNFWISLRMPNVVNLVNIFHSNSVCMPSTRFNSLDVVVLRIPLDLPPPALIFPSTGQNRRWCRLWQWHIDQARLCHRACRHPPQILENDHAFASGFCLTTDQLFCFTEKAVPLFSRDNSVQISYSCHSPFPNELLLGGWYSWIFPKWPKSHSNLPKNHLVVSYTDLPDHGEDGFHAMRCVRRYVEIVVPMSLPYSFWLSWSTEELAPCAKGCSPSFIVLGNRFSFVVPSLSRRIVGVLWIFFFLTRRVLPAALPSTRQGMHPLTALETSTLRRMRLVQYSSCYRVSAKLSASPDF